MRALAKIAVVLAGASLLAGDATAQETNSIPSISIIRWAVSRYGATTVVYDRDAGIGTLADIGNFIHLEADDVSVRVEVIDADWDPTATDNTQQDQIYLAWYALGNTLYSPPEPTPIEDAQPDLFGASENEGFTPSGDPLRVTYTFRFEVPEFLGKNQSRLRGAIDFDVMWVLVFEAANGNSDSDVRGETSTILKAIENPALAPSNPPAFADAGADKTVPIGVEVLLDGRRTFDAFNVGFDPNSANVFDKDQLTFSWEWVSGPRKVDPVQTSDRSAVATVTFPDISYINDPADPNDAYVFRLTVDDNVNALPSTDTVRIRVVAELPSRTPPRAIIVGPANPVPVGTVVTLCGRRSCDPDCDPNCTATPAIDPCADPNYVPPCESELNFRWQQTNELGEPLDIERVGEVFQPLSGLDQPSITWQALVPGTYYFRLLVDDGDFQATTTFSVTVVEQQTQGETVSNDETAVSDSGATDDDSLTGGSAALPAPAALCGAGLLPVAVVPLALAGIKLRRR